MMAHIGKLKKSSPLWLHFMTSVQQQDSIQPVFFPFYFSLHRFIFFVLFWIGSRVWLNCRGRCVNSKINLARRSVFGSDTFELNKAEKTWQVIEIVVGRYQDEKWWLEAASLQSPSASSASPPVCGTTIFSSVLKRCIFHNLSHDSPRASSSYLEWNAPK